MERWNELLDHLAAGPREDGTKALEETAGWLQRTLVESGLDVQLYQWTAHPWRLRTIGVIAFLCAAAYVALLRSKRHWAALAVALLFPAWVVAEYDFGLPLLGALHGVPQVHVVAKVPAAEGPATRRLILSSHYDTKTDLLDHLERAPVTFLGMPLAALLVAAAIFCRGGKRRGLAVAAQVGAVVNGLGMLVVQTGGALPVGRSPGAIDSGAGCAVLVRLARELHEKPLPHTEVELVFFSGEEIGLEGSRVYARERFGRGADLPTFDLNLDGVGEASAMAYFKSESVLLRSFPDDLWLVAQVDEVQRARLGVPLHRTFYSAAADARSFLEVGVPAVTLFSDLPGHAIPRHMHSTRDARSRVELQALEDDSAILLEVARRVDGASLPPQR